MTANPPQSRAPPGGPPEAQGATSDQASRRLQIRSALLPQAGSGDPPSVPSTPARLRAAAPLPEGPGPPSKGSRGQPAPALGPHHPSCYSKTKHARGSGGAEGAQFPDATSSSFLPGVPGGMHTESPAACFWPCSARCGDPLCPGWPVLRLDPCPGPLTTVRGHLFKKSPRFPWSGRTRAVPSLHP